MNKIISRREEHIEKLEKSIKKFECEIEETRLDLERIEKEGIRTRHEIIKTAQKEIDVIIDRKLKDLARKNEETIQAMRDDLNEEMKNLYLKEHFQVKSLSQKIMAKLFLNG
jgi:bacterioferritin (cytochrome b1)